MYDRKRIFIGSSKESENIAKKVKELLSNKNISCDIWNDNFFEQSKSTYETLYKKSILYDYAIFIGGKDDFVKRISEKTKKYAPRDNVYFEMGIYAGILSPSRTFFIIDKECKIASDLSGITVCKYGDITVEKCCEIISTKIDEENQVSRIGLLPSVSLAIGYYRNFICKVCKEIYNMQNIVIDNKAYDVSTYDKHLNIIIPRTTYTDWESEWLMYCTENNFADSKITCELRSFGVKCSHEELRGKKLDFFDIPLTMKSSFETVDFVIGKDFIGDTESVRISKQKEIESFISTLKLLIDRDSFVKKIVHIKTI